MFEVQKVKMGAEKPKRLFFLLIINSNYKIGFEVVFDILPDFTSFRPTKEKVRCGGWGIFHLGNHTKSQVLGRNPCSHWIGT